MGIGLGWVELSWVKLDWLEFKVNLYWVELS